MFGLGEERARVGRGGAAGPQRLDPGREQLLSAVDQVQEGGCRRPVELQPAVEGLLHAPGRFAQRTQPDHAAAALEGVKAAADGDQGVEGLHRLARAVEFGADAGEDLVGLFDEDAKQLGVHVRFAGGQGGLRNEGGAGQRRLFQGRRADVLQFGQGIEVEVGCECAWVRRGLVACGRGGRRERMRLEVGQIQVGEIQVRQVEGAEIQPARCCGRRREGQLCGAGVGHGRRFASETGRRFPGRGLRGCGIVLCDLCFALAPALGVQEVVKFGRAVGEGLEIKAERGELVGQGLESRSVGVGRRVGEAGDTRARIAHQRQRAGFAEQAERADDLLQRAVELGERFVLGLVAEVVVQGLLDLTQADAHFATELNKGFVFLAGACALGVGAGDVRRRRFTAHQGLNAAQALVDLLRECVVEYALLEVGLQQQQGGGDLERECVRVLQRVTTQPLGKRLQTLEQVQGGGAAESGRHRHEGAEALVEVGERDCRAGVEGVPLLAYAGERLL